MLLFFAYSFFVFLLFLLYPVVKDKYLTLTLLVGVALYWGFSLIMAIDIPEYMELFDLILVTGNPQDSIDSLYGTPSAHMERGFLYLLWFCKSLIPNFFFFQFVLFSSELLLVYYGLQRLLKDKDILFYMMCLLSFFLSSFLLNALRQGIPIALFIFALPFLLEKKYVKYLLCVLFGAFFHVGSLLLLIIPLWVIFCRSFIRNSFVMWAIFLVCNIAYFFHFTLSSYSETWILLLFGEMSDIRDYSIYSSTTESNFGFLKILELDTCYFIVFFFKFLDNRLYKYVAAPIFLLFFLTNMLIGGIAVHRLSYFFQILYYVILYDGLSVLMCKYGISKKMSYLIIFCYMYVFFLTQFSLLSPRHIYEYHLFDFLS